MQWQIDLLSSLISVFLAFTLLIFILQTAFCNSYAFLFHFNKQRFECLILPQTKSTCAFIRGEPGESARDPGSCLSCLLFSTLNVWLSPLETLYHFALHTFVSVSVARGLEYWTVFILVVTGSPRRAMADNSWSDWLCCLSVKSV